MVKMFLLQIIDGTEIVVDKRFATWSDTLCVKNVLCSTKDLVSNLQIVEGCYCE